MSSSFRNISILGSTGSIGRNTLKVAEHLGNLTVSALAAGRNMAVLAEQVRAFNPALAACADEDCAKDLELRLCKLGVKSAEMPEIVFGEKGLVKAATIPEAGTLVSATVGAVGFVPTLRAIEAGKRVALANKETLVMAGELMTRAARSSAASRSRTGLRLHRGVPDRAPVARHPAGRRPASSGRPSG